jgi:aminopeptidase N
MMDKKELETELAKDNTFTGQLSYQTCLAAFPDQTAKDEAFKSISVEDITNSQRESKLQGFQRPLHRKVLANYVDKYFDLLLSTWNGKSYEVASKIVNGLYPTYVINQDTLAKTNKWLDTTGKDAAAGLRRLVSEARDAMQRALNVQSID